MSRLRIAIFGLLAAAAVAWAMDGPRVVRVIVEKMDGTTQAREPPEPRVLGARAIPGPQELARLAAEKARPVRTVERPALAAPLAPVHLTARDRESLRWLRRLHAKFPGRFDRMMVNNPRARWLIGEEAKLTEDERRALHTDEDEDDG